MPKAASQSDTPGPDLTVTVRRGFPAAHRIRIDGAGTLEPVHVHHWRAAVCLEPGDDPDRVAAAAAAALADWVARHRGRSFNDVPPFEQVNPTAEEVARVLAGFMRRRLPGSRLRQVTIGEAAGFSATYTPSNR